MEPSRTRSTKSVASPWASPMLRWAGSKRKLLPVLMSHVPFGFARYIEPFAGSACLFFALRPEAAVLGDINENLLNTYSTIRDHPRLVARQVASWRATSAEYYRIRSLRDEELEPVHRAARFVYLNRYCFNGVYRTNRSGHFNVPRGVRTGTLPSEQVFFRCAVAIRKAELRPGDFEHCLNDVGKSDFVYLDPPYASRGRPRFGEYGYGCFADNDIKRLVQWLQQIDRAGAAFLLSYSDTAALKALTKKWNRRRLDVRRHVAGFADHRARVRELLVSNRDFD